MPNPKKYKNQKDFMKDCLHQTLHKERKNKEQGVAQCLNMWRKRMAEKIASKYIAETSSDLHPNYIQDHSNCPVCGERYKMTCRCRIGDKSCSNKHSWHTCSVHNKVFIGGGSHAEGCLKLGSDCTCPSETIKTADYPEHPDEVVISKSELIAGDKEIREIDVYNYYSGVKSKMIPELKGRNLFIAVKPKILKKGEKPVYIRHPYDKKTDYIRINNADDFETYHSGKTVEYHVTMPQIAPYYVIDFDAAGDWKTTKEITAEIADELKKLPEVKSIEIRYTGKRGFHVLGWLKKAKDVDDSREYLKQWLKDTFGDRDDVVVGESPSGKKGALGLSPMKLNGGQVAKFSLRITGLCCIEVPRASLMGFEKEDATIDKVYKKLTGGTFGYNKKEAADKIEFHPEVPGAPLEEPTAYAVKVLINESPISSGWHNGFEQDFNGLKPCWAIIFKGDLTGPVIRAAQDAGLEINKRENIELTDVYLPDVIDPSEARNVFNKFAENYKKNTQKRTSVLNHYINEGSVVVGTVAPVKKQFMAERIVQAFFYRIGSQLSEYKKKRDPKKTPEPFDSGEGKNIFVIQRHKADRAGLHFDLRLQQGKTLRSWAVKKHKLPSKGEKLLAVEVEPHPLSYSDFEGKIPKGEYGAGDVEIYDKGTYETISKDKKKWVFKLNGKHEGTYVLVNIGDKNWLFIKSGKNYEQP